MIPWSWNYPSTKFHVFSRVSTVSAKLCKRLSVHIVSQGGEADERWFGLIGQISAEFKV